MAPPDPRQAGRAERLRQAVHRDGGRCVWCGRAFADLIHATRDHLIPRVRGGPSWLENEVPACRRCNSQRGHRGAIEWLRECEGRGWTPDEDAVAAALHALDEAITERGVQRRARAHLASQLRQLRRREAGGAAVE